MRLDFSTACRTFTFSPVEVILLCLAALMASRAMGQTHSNPLVGSPPSISINDLEAPKSAWNEYRKGRDAALKNESADALRHLEKALEHFPRFSAAFTLKGILELDRGQLDAAEIDLQHAISLSPTDSAAYSFLGALYIGLRRFDEAKYCLQRALSLSPTSWHAQLEMAHLYYRTGHFDESWKYLGRAERLLPPNLSLVSKARLYLLRGYVLMQMKKDAEAKNDLRTVLKYCDPGTPYAMAASKQLEKLQTPLPNSGDLDHK